MAEYYPLLSRAVASLHDAPPEARRAIYDRARQALLGQLRSMEPPVPAEDIERESVALDDAIARVETDIVGPPTVAAPVAPPSPAPASPPTVSPQPSAPAVPASEPPVAASSLDPAARQATVLPQPSAAPATVTTVRPAAPGLTSLRAGLPPGPSRPPGPPRPVQPMRPASTSRPVAAPVIRASRETDDPAQATPKTISSSLASQSPGLPSASRLQVPSPTAEPNEPLGTDASAHEQLPDTPQFPPTKDRSDERTLNRDESNRPAAPRPVRKEPFSPRVLIVALVAAVVVAGIAYTAWRLRDKPEAMARARAALQAAQKSEPQSGKIVSRADGTSAPPTILADKTPATEKATADNTTQPDPSSAAPQSQPSAAQSTAALPSAGAAPEAAPAQPTSNDAANAPAAGPTDAANPPAAAPNDSSTQPAATSTADPSAPLAASTAPAAPAPTSAATPPSTATAPASSDETLPVSQRAALLVDAPDDPQKVKTYVGSVVWHAENVSPGQGQPLAQAVRADIEIPDANLKMSMLFQKNFEQQFPASHTMDLRFTPGPGNQLGNVKQINVPQLRRDDSPTGDTLVGLPVTITDNYFLVGLTRGDVESRNLDLIKSRNWFDVPLLLVSGKVAKITFEKGTSGQRIIESAIQSWQSATP
ncbi:hypothetical protein [Lichenihabitans psoromatis]|uniref:hypothetical protein n=1 Tax=Lichenihabitans psoromatis TaxID=2528642 RepID=UPI0010366CCE|nr:hypothetical protein [Lichenihabitans psoromatis]